MKALSYFAKFGEDVVRDKTVERENHDRICRLLNPLFQEVQGQHHTEKVWFYLDDFLCFSPLARPVLGKLFHSGLVLMKSFCHLCLFGDTKSANSVLNKEKQHYP